MQPCISTVRYLTIVTSQSSFTCDAAGAEKNRYPREGGTGETVNKSWFHNWLNDTLFRLYPKCEFLSVTPRHIGQIESRQILNFRTLEFFECSFWKFVNILFVRRGLNVRPIYEWYSVGHHDSTGKKLITWCYMDNEVSPTEERTIIDALEHSVQYEENLNVAQWL